MYSRSYTYNKYGQHDGDIVFVIIIWYAAICSVHSYKHTNVRYRIFWTFNDQVHVPCVDVYFVFVDVCCVFCCCVLCLLLMCIVPCTDVYCALYWCVLCLVLMCIVSCDDVYRVLWWCVSCLVLVCIVSCVDVYRVLCWCVSCLVLMCIVSCVDVYRVLCWCVLCLPTQDTFMICLWIICNFVQFMHIRCFSRMICALTLTLLTWRIWWAPINASRWQMEFNWAFKGLSNAIIEYYFVVQSDWTHNCNSVACRQLKHPLAWN
jgi:hypothetical protein